VCIPTDKPATFRNAAVAAESAIGHHPQACCKGRADFHLRRILIPAFILILAGLHALYYMGWTHDDPFITYRYVENVVAGRGFVFNIGERLEGYSNFLFLIMLIPASLSGLSLLAASQLYGFLSFLAAVAVLFFHQANHRREMHWTAFLAPLLLAFSGDAVFWSVSGMETGVSLLTVGLGWICFCREMKRDARMFPWSALLFLAAALNRPEGVLIFAALLPAAFMALRRGDVSLRRLLFWACLFLVPFGIYNVWRYLYFGELLPNTFYAKATGSPSYQMRMGVAYLAAFLKRNPHLLLALPAVVIPLLSKRLSLERSTALALVLGQCAFIVYCGGDWMPIGRFMVPVLLPLLYLVSEGLFDLMEHMAVRDALFRRRDAIGLLFAVLLLVSLVQERRATRPIVYSFRTDTLYKPHIVIGLWMAENLPPGSLLAAEEAGIIPYYSGLPFLDLLGIVDSHIARREGEMHGKHDVNYVLMRRPDYVLIYTLNPFSPGEPPIPRIESGRRLLESPEFTARYRPFLSFPHGNEVIGRDYLTLFERIPRP